MNAKQRRLYNQLQARFDAVVAERLRHSLRDSGDTAGVEAVDALEREHGMTSGRRTVYVQHEEPTPGSMIHIRGYECRVIRTVGSDTVDMEDGLRKAPERCDMPCLVYVVLVEPTGYTRSSPSPRQSREMDRAQEVARIKEG